MERILQVCPLVSDMVATAEWLVHSIITGHQLSSRSTSLLAPPQLTGEQNAYIPYKVAKETITKVIIVAEEMYSVHLTHYIHLTLDM